MVAVLGPVEAHRRQEGIARHLLDRAEGVAGALDDQGRGPEVLEARGAQALGPARRVKGITEADERADGGFLGDEASTEERR